MKKQYTLLIVLALVICLIAPLCAFAAPQYPFAAGASDTTGTDDKGAYIGEDGKLYPLTNGNALADGPIYAVVHADADAAYYLTPADGAAPYRLMRARYDGTEATVLAVGVRGYAYYMDGAFYYIDDAEPVKVMAVTPTGNVNVAVTLKPDEEDDGVLSPGADGMYYEIPGVGGMQAQYLLSPADGTANLVEGDAYYHYRRFDTIETAMLDGAMVARKIGDADWKPLGSEGGDAAEIDGTLYYVDTRDGATAQLIKYDASMGTNMAVGAMPTGSTGQLVAADGWLFTVSTGDSALIRISPIDGTALPITAAPDADVTFGVRLISLGSDIMLYTTDSSHMPVQLFSINASDLTPDAQETTAPAELDDTDEPDESDEPDEAVPTGMPLLDESDEPVEPTEAAPTAIPEPTSTPRPEKTPGKSGYVALLRGDWGKQVKRLQTRLVELGYLAKGSVDGSFGKGTQAAVKLFQKKLRLKETGVASIELQKKLFAKNAPKYTDEKYVELAKGDKGDSVAQLQKRLKKLGYYAGSTAGKYDAKTVSAVKLFQKAIGVKQTGKASVALQKKLFAKNAPKYSADEYIELRPGDTGERVKKLQRRLKKLGYFDGNIGGNYLTKTTAAVKRFQAEIGEKKTGVASVKLQKNLFGKNAPVNPNPLPGKK